MIDFSVVLIIIGVSIDGMISGFAYGISKIKLPFLSLLVILIIPAIMCLVVMLLASTFNHLLSEELVKWLSFGIMLLLAGLSARQYFVTLSIKHRHLKMSFCPFSNSVRLHVSLGVRASGREIKKILKNPNFKVPTFNGQSNIFGRKKLRKNKATLDSVLINPELADTDKLKDINKSEAVLVGFAVGLDASVASISLAFAGASIILTSVLMGIGHFLLVGIGNNLGKILKIRGNWIRLISVVIFLTMAVLKLI